MKDDLTPANLSRSAMGFLSSDVPESELRGMLSESPSNGDVLLALGNCLAEQGRFAEAMDLIKVVPNSSASDVGLLLTSADIHALCREYLGAIELYRRVLDARPSDARALIGIAYCGVCLTDVNLVDALWPSLPLWSDDPRLNFVKVDYLQRHSQRDSAEMLVRSLRAEFESSTFGRRWLVRYLDHLGDYQGALAYALESLAVSRSPAQSYECSRLLYIVGEYQRAKGCLGSLTEDDVWYRFELAGLIAYRLEEFTDSLMYLEHARRDRSSSEQTCWYSILAALACERLSKALSLAVNGVKRYPSSERIYSITKRMAIQMGRLDALVAIMYLRMRAH